MECCLSMTWWQAEELITKIAMLRPPRVGETPPTVTDNEIVGGKRPTPIPLRDQRITQCAVYFDVIDWFGDMEDDGNYLRIREHSDVDASSSAEYRDVKTRVIHAPWFGSSDDGIAFRLATSLVSRFRDAPRKVQLMIEDALAESVSTGGVVKLTTNAMQDAAGNAKTILGWARCKKRQRGNQITHVVEWVSAGFSGRYWLYAPTSFIGNTYATATDEEREYAFIADSDGRMSDGSPGYKIQ